VLSVAIISSYIMLYSLLRTFALEVRQLEVGDRHVSESLRVEAAWTARDDVGLGLEPTSEPFQVTVAVEWIR